MPGSFSLYDDELAVNNVLHANPRVLKPPSFSATLALTRNCVDENEAAVVDERVDDGVGCVCHPHITQESRNTCHANRVCSRRVGSG